MKHEGTRRKKICFICVICGFLFHCLRVRLASCVTGTNVTLKKLYNHPFALIFCLRRPGGTLFEKTAPPPPDLPAKTFIKICFICLPSSVLCQLSTHKLFQPQLLNRLQRRHPTPRVPTNLPPIIPHHLPKIKTPPPVSPNHCRRLPNRPRMRL